MQPKLIVTVDTEEEGLWNGAFESGGQTVRNVEGVPRFQACCDRFGVRPTYLVDTPVVEDDRAVEILARIHDAGRCEIGAHLHPWCAPPSEKRAFDEKTHRRNSFTCNLPAQLQREKLTRLTETIEQRFGTRPTSFRAGRYGLDARGARILEALGYVVDSSVIPFHDYSGQGGPDFRRAPCTPYWIGPHDLCTPAADGRLLEVPVSVGFTRSKFELASAVRELVSGVPGRWFRLVGILDRLNLVRRVKFSPERAGGARMKQLVDAYLARRAPCMVMMLHSSSLVAGYSPYVADEHRLESFYQDLEAVFEHCLKRRAMTADTLTGFAESFPTPPEDLSGEEHVRGPRLSCEAK